MPVVRVDIVSASRESIHDSYGRSSSVRASIRFSRVSRSSVISQTFIQVNLTIFQNLLRKRLYSLTVFIEKFRLFPGVLPRTSERRRASTEYSSMTVSGSMIVPQLLLILRPSSLSTSPWRYIVLNGV